MIVLIFLLMIRMDVISGLRNNFKKEVTCQVKRRKVIPNGNQCASISIRGLSRLAACRKCSNYIDGRKNHGLGGEPCVYGEGGKGRWCYPYAYAALDVKRSLVTFIMSCPRTCDAWTQKEPTGCPTRCGMDAGLGPGGAVVCSTGGGVNVNCLEDEKPKPKQCPATDPCVLGNWIKNEPSGCATKCGVGEGLTGKPGEPTCDSPSCDPDAKPAAKQCPATADCGNWEQAEPTRCATKCGVAAGKSGTPGAVTCDSPSCDEEKKPDAKQCPKTDNCGKWKQAEPSGCATKCGVAAGKSGTPGAVTCNTTSCDADTKPAAKQCPATRDCDISECGKANVSVRAGEYVFKDDGSCLVLPCTNARAGEYYTGSGSPRTSGNTTGDCTKAKCDTSLLENGQFFAPPISNATCRSLVRDCNTGRVPAGYMFNGSDACSLIKCRSVTGKYFVEGRGICKNESCINKPKAGFRYVPKRWSNQAKECRTEKCTEAPEGQFFIGGCRTAPCTKAPVGSYYLHHGGTKDNCPYTSCSNAKTGQRYLPGFVRKGECRRDNCPEAPAPPGFYFGRPGFCNLTRCTSGKRGTYYTQGCAVGACTNGNASTYFVPGFNTNAANCAIKDCIKPPPPGLLFANATGCEIKVCTNAPAGWYYTQVRQERTAYLGDLKCPVARCSPPQPDRRFVAGFATDRNACPTQPCNRSRLPKGHYFNLTDDYTKCTPTPCEALAGYFYLHSAEGGRAGCSKVRAECINAKLGQKYKAQTELVVRKTGCPVESCDSPPAGKEFGTKGSCEHLVSCTTATAGQYYVDSSAAKPCQVKKCNNAAVGEYYNTGEDKLDPNWQTKHTCPVAKCVMVQGYTFKKAGKCSGMRRCDAAPAGFYFKDSRTLPCQQDECKPRGHWRFVAGFALRPDKCPRKKCIGTPPAKYESLDSCDAAITTTPASSVTGPDWPFTMPVVVVMAVGSGTLFVVVVIVIISCAVKKRNAKLNPVSQRAVVYASNNQEAEDTTDTTDMLDECVSYSIANKAASKLGDLDFLLNPGDVTVGRKLAQGAGGQIFMGRFADQDVALKESYDMLMNECDNELVREAAMMTKLRHHYIVRFFGIWMIEGQTGDEDRVFLVMELCPNGDLRDAAEDPDNTLQERKQWIVQVASAMEYLHGRTPPIVHRDLKPQNVLLDAKRNAKVCDFGTSKTMEKSRDMTVGVGTVAYMAPEQMRAFTDSSSIKIMTADGTKFDVFSFAMLALFVATGEAPYHGLDNNNIFIKVGMHGGRTAIPSGYAGVSSENKEEDNYDNFVKLVKQMWHENPEDRPAFDIIVNQLCQSLFNI